MTLGMVDDILIELSERESSLMSIAGFRGIGGIIILDYQQALNFIVYYGVGDLTVIAFQYESGGFLCNDKLVLECIFE